MESVVYAVASLIFAAGIVAVYLAVRARRRAVSGQAKILWVHEQARRALELIRKEDPEQILIGLQMLSVYDIPAIRIQAFPRLVVLAEHDDKRVADLAGHVIKLSQHTKAPPEPDLALHG